MLVYTAVAIPFLGPFSNLYRDLIGAPIRGHFLKTEKAKDQESKFDPNYGSHGNNTHCIAKVCNIRRNILRHILRNDYRVILGNKYHYACAI